MGKLKLIIINIKNAVCSIFWKKDSACVLVDAWFGQRFADNPRYLFQYLSENKKRLGLKHVVWVTHSPKVLETVRAMGYEAYLIDSDESIYYHKRAKYHIANNAPMGAGNLTGELLVQYSYRAKRINLWHGTGVIKNFGLMSNEYKKKTEKCPKIFGIKNELYRCFSVLRKFTTVLGAWGDCYFLSTSKTECVKLEGFFGCNRKQVIVSGYPRDSYDCRCTKIENEVIDRLKEYTVSILYLPTFRSDNSDFDFRHFSESIKPILREKNMLLIQKAHSASDNHDDFALQENVLTLDPDFDINVLTPRVDYVVTDYSSILADALYFYKPVILYVPDYDEYMTGDRGLCKDAEFMLSAAKRFYDCDTFLKCFGEKYTDPEFFKTNEYKRVRRRIWGTMDKDIGQIWNDIVDWTN